MQGNLISWFCLFSFTPLITAYFYLKCFTGPPPLSAPFSVVPLVLNCFLSLWLYSFPLCVCLYPRPAGQVSRWAADFQAPSSACDWCSCFSIVHQCTWREVWLTATTQADFSVSVWSSALFSLLWVHSLGFMSGPFSLALPSDRFLWSFTLFLSFLLLFIIFIPFTVSVTAWLWLRRLLMYRNLTSVLEI